MAEAYIYRKGVSPNTRVLNPQRVRVYSLDADTQLQTQIGLIQTWNPSDTRAIEPVRGIGFGDQIAELAVGVTDLSATATIMMMYLRDIQQMFGYKAGSSGLIRSLKHHQWPFDVYETIILPSYLKGGEGIDTRALNNEMDKSLSTSVIGTWYEGCWMSDFSKTFDIGATSVTQDMTCQVSDVYANKFNSELVSANTSNNKSIRATELGS
jgi:hypothetical protein